MTTPAIYASQENSPDLSTVMHKQQTQTSVGTRAMVLVGEAWLTCRCSYLDTGRRDCKTLTPSFFVRSRLPFLSRSFCSCLSVHVSSPMSYVWPFGSRNPSSVEVGRREGRARGPDPSRSCVSCLSGTRQPPRGRLNSTNEGIRIFGNVFTITRAACSISSVFSKAMSHAIPTCARMLTLFS